MVALGSPICACAGQIRSPAEAADHDVMNGSGRGHASARPPRVLNSWMLRAGPRRALRGFTVSVARAEGA